jgi:hypothetical protein
MTQRFTRTVINENLVGYLYDIPNHWSIRDLCVWDDPKEKKEKKANEPREI